MLSQTIFTPSLMRLSTGLVVVEGSKKASSVALATPLIDDAAPTITAAGTATTFYRYVLIRLEVS
ncbi:MAG: hypothetical protein CBC94_002920 [Gammaproteobacteria bacterium TMED134]|nr:MAG: hypothetical protein CBC94_002920 [Gammaproteobacteria bacterium TMED134]